MRLRKSKSKTEHAAQSYAAGEDYRESSIRSGTCFNLNPKFLRLVLEVFQKL